MVLSDRFVLPFLGLPRVAKRAMALLADASFSVLTVWIAYCLRLNDWVVMHRIEWLPVAVSLVIAIPIFITTGLYRQSSAMPALPPS